MLINKTWASICDTVQSEVSEGSLAQFRKEIEYIIATYAISACIDSEVRREVEYICEANNENTK